MATPMAGDVNFARTPERNGKSDIRRRKQPLCQCEDCPLNYINGQGDHVSSFDDIKLRNLSTTFGDGQSSPSASRSPTPDFGHAGGISPSKQEFEFQKLREKSEVIWDVWWMMNLCNI